MANADLQSAIRRLQALASEADLTPRPERRVAAISRLDTALACAEIRAARARLQHACARIEELRADAQKAALKFAYRDAQRRAILPPTEG